MTFTLTLDALPGAVALETWRALYATTLRLMLDHPLALVREARMRQGARRVLSHRLEHGDGALRCWTVSGDARSGRRGDAFALYRSPARYGLTDPAPVGARPHSVLAALSTAPSSRGLRRVWGGDTRRAPYRAALLAAGIWAERACPSGLALQGEAREAEVDAACRWLEAATGASVPRPRAWDAQRLWDALGAHVRGRARVSAYARLYCGDALGSLHRFGVGALGWEAYQAWWRDALRACESVSSPQAQALLASWLGAGASLEALVELACMDPEGPRLDPAALGDVLVAQGLTLGAQGHGTACDRGGVLGRAVLVHRRPVGWVALAFMRAAGGPWSWWCARLEQATERAELRLAREASAAERWRSPSALILLSDANPRGYGLHLWAASSARRVAEGWACVGEGEGVDAARGRLEALCERLDLVLTEDAWAWIDREEDAALLGFVAGLVAWSGARPSDALGALRYAVLERRAVAARMVELSRAPGWEGWSMSPS